MRFARFFRALPVLPALAMAIAIQPATATDLLVAPTRILLDGQRGTEVILNNIGSETATYRISLELRRMTAEGRLAEVPSDEANAMEQAAKQMIRYAPRRVTLPPNQPQAVRIGVRPPAGLADGEYRAHMLFRAIPKARPVTESAVSADGVSIALTPIYGVTIPIIIRQGQLESTAALANPRLETGADGPALAFELSHSGTRSSYGEIHVSKPGIGDPLFVARGIAIYPEIVQRKVTLPVSPEIVGQLRGPVIVEYREDPSAGGGLIAKVEQVLR